MNIKDLRKTIEELKKETKLPDWDDSGAEAIPEEIWDRAYEDAIWFSQQSNIELSYICPSSDGSVCFDWYNNGKEFDLEYTPYNLISEKLATGGSSHYYEWSMRIDKYKWNFGSSSDKNEVLKQLIDYFK